MNMDSINKYDWIGEFHQGIAIVKKNYKFGAIMMGGKEIIPPIYDELSDFENGYAKAKYKISEYQQESKVINLSGQIQVKKDNKLFFLPSQFEWGSDFVGNVCVIRKNGKPGLIDLEYKTIVPIGEYDYLNIFCEKLIEVAKNSKIEDVPGIHIKRKTFSDWGIIDVQGNTIIPCHCTEISIYPHKEVFIITTLINDIRHYGVVDKSGSVILPFTYSYLGYLNSIIIYSYNANVEIENNDYYQGKFHEDSTFGLMDSDFSVLTQALYKIIATSDECIIVRKNGELGILNMQGKEIIEFGKYDYIEFDESGLIKVAKGIIKTSENTKDNHKNYTKWGVINSSGETIASCWYSAISIVEGPYILACIKIPIDDIYDGREFEDEEDKKYYYRVKGEEDNPSYGLWEIINKEGDTLLEDVEGEEFVANNALDCYLEGSIPNDIDNHGCSYSKYGRYNGWDDDSIDEAFDGDPELTWNVD